MMDNNLMNHRRMKRKDEMSEEVKQAVDDLLNGTGTSSADEWLQREYIRLLRREASYRRDERESKLNPLTDQVAHSQQENGEHLEQDRSDQQ